MDDGRASGYVLYYNQYSVCSLMVLYSLALKGERNDSEDEIKVQTRVVDIFHEEQLEEHFLCDINHHGQVPVLAHRSELDRPIADSVEMTLWLAARYPQLIPAVHEGEIRQYLKDLHALNYFSLSFPGRPEVAQGFEDGVNRRLDDPNISDRYRKALEFKLAVIKRDKTGGLVPSETAKNEKHARELLASLENCLGRPDQWIYGSQPTALDAHLVVFMARMSDVGRDQLIPEKLKQYGAWAMQSPEWIKMMDGRKTMIPH
ncbi:hypothetical protein EDD37DRAFT_404837 [Exophiala viscosa]|uniref:GST N-terminal domain-containing protein n=1 Tax=Exophiala viscosa TaxID=2486360 RepID=A0AAN6IEV2_9EURO|nr:hypothetical protein EDD36DRAFT_167490 [Exophiala viscosa]KAI1624234.1 hypothetical protein EDD37DRAFT_404837 [Exophiala viscosa]